MLSVVGTFCRELTFVIEFADPPPPPLDLSHLSLAPTDAKPKSPPEDVIPAAGAPTTLIQWAVVILNTADPSLKVCDS